MLEPTRKVADRLLDVYLSQGMRIDDSTAVMEAFESDAPKMLAVARKNGIDVSAAEFAETEKS